MTYIFFVMLCFTMLMSLMGVAFITLLERKILGYMQIRLGPNKIGPIGMLQPMADAVKLYTKEMNWPKNSNHISFMLAPIISLALAMIIWMTLPIFKDLMTSNSTFLLFLSILGMGVYPILIAGWSSNSNYSFLGGMRSLAQTISYEVSLVFILLSSMIMISSINFDPLSFSFMTSWFMLFLVPMTLWMISLVAELNRTPFDFAEGESELVSGFNTEYSSGKFAIIFMGEYMMIIFFSVFTNMMFFGVKLSSLPSILINMIFMFFFVWTRATFPRYRYDKLMNLSWKIILPTSTFNLFIVNTMLILGKYKSKSILLEFKPKYDKSF